MHTWDVLGSKVNAPQRGSKHAENQGNMAFPTAPDDDGKGSCDGGWQPPLAYARTFLRHLACMARVAVPMAGARRDPACRAPAPVTASRRAARWAGAGAPRRQSSPHHTPLWDVETGGCCQPPCRAGGTRLGAAVVSMPAAPGSWMLPTCKQRDPPGWHEPGYKAHPSKASGPDSYAPEEQISSLAQWHPHTLPNRCCRLSCRLLCSRASTSQARAREKLASRFMWSASAATTCSRRLHAASGLR